MKVWAHRGCSQRYPENTMLAFEKAIQLKELTGIELDIQMTKDGELVVFHDERVERTTEGMGYVKDYTLVELKKLHIYADSNATQRIPTISEVLDLLEGKLRKGLKLNIELKNGIFAYEGMEKKIVDLVEQKGLASAVIYSTVYGKSLEKLKKLNTKSELAILGTKVSDCIFMMNGGCGATAVHPFWKGIDEDREKLKNYTVRAWMLGHLYPEQPTGTKLDFEMLKAQGITDIMLNEPEVYIR